MRRASTVDISKTISLVLLLVGILVIGGVVLLAVRTQRGLLGIVLALLAVGVILYWLREGRKGVLKELKVQKQEEPWTYDLIEDGQDSLLVAKVPGPESRVRVKASGQSIEIRGGDNFKQVVSLARKVEVLRTTYVNGVLQVRLRKLEAQARTK